MDPLFWGCHSNHFLCRAERVWPSTPWRWNYGEYSLGGRVPWDSLAFLLTSFVPRSSHKPSSVLRPKGSNRYTLLLTCLPLTLKCYGDPILPPTAGFKSSIPQDGVSTGNLHAFTWSRIWPQNLFPFLFGYPKLSAPGAEGSPFETKALREP